MRAERSRRPSAPPTSAECATWRARSRTCTSSWRAMPTLLLEIGCEELPAGACREAEQQLPGLSERELGAAPTHVYVGPRRLALLLEDVAEQTPDEWIKGP